MSATGKLTVTELEARYKSGGTQSIKNYYRKFPVLVVFPDNSGSNSITWTPHSTDHFALPAKPATPESGELDHVKVVPSLPTGSVIVPIRGLNEEDLTIEVGREALSDVQLAHPSVSRNHARFDNSGGRWTITDLNSKNGTVVDGIKLLPGKTYNLTPYLEIRFGEVATMFLDWKALIDVCELG